MRVWELQGRHTIMQEMEIEEIEIDRQTDRHRNIFIVYNTK